jgi:DNA-binding transcriptional regulator YdaS (Cro superfamily)
MNLHEYLSQANRSQADFAKALNVTQGMVWQWLNDKRPIAAHHCRAIERLTDGAVTAVELRPDVFGDGSTPSPQPAA